MIERLLDMVGTWRKRIVVVGDAMWDRWVEGRVEFCQDRCPKFAQESVRVTDGGAANAHQCLQHWGVNTDLFAVSDVHRSVKTRFLVGEKIVWRHDDDRIVDSRYYEWAHRAVLEMCHCASAVLLSDYDKGFLTPEFIAGVAKVCAECKIPCVADCKRVPEVYAGCVLKGNAVWAVRHFDSTKCRDGMVVTQGPSEPWFPEQPLPRWPSVKCVNHVGAGDCFAAHLALALAYGFPLGEAAAIAHSAGRVYVQRPYNRAPYPQEVAADLETKKATSSTMPTVEEVAEAYREDVAGS